MKALVGAFNQEKALVGAFSVIVQLVVEPMDRFAALVTIPAPGHLTSPGLRPREARVKSAGSSATSSFQRWEAGPRMLTCDNTWYISTQHYTEVTPTPCCPPTSHSRPSTAARQPSLTGEVRLARNLHALVPFLTT